MADFDGYDRARPYREDRRATVARELSRLAKDGLEGGQEAPGAAKSLAEYLSAHDARFGLSGPLNERYAALLGMPLPRTVTAGDAPEARED